MYKNQFEIRTVGLARSGNHAILNWLINQLNGKYCFLNCAEPKHSPFETARPFNDRGEVLVSNVPGLDIAMERKGRFSKKDFLVHSYEDCYLGMLNGPLSKKNHDSWVGASKRQANVLILRDPFNLFASRIKAGLIFGHHTHNASPISPFILKRLYKQHAREYLGEIRKLDNKVCINYNRWSEDKLYRKQITGELGLPFNDDGFHEVQECAGGSSFDGRDFNNNASQMRVFNRWQHYADDEEYWALFDEEMVHYAEQIFGETPAVRAWKKRSLKKIAV